MDKPPTIGVFDSGFGGLTVLRALLPLIPGAHYIYLGDTARLPYGAKSQATIARYAVESARFLAQQGCDHLVIACNTASALALDDIRAAVPIPVHGVIEPGARAASLDRPKLADWKTGNSKLETQNAQPETQNAQLAARSPQMEKQSSAPPQVLVLATAATVASRAYRNACAALGLQATEFACPLLVPLVEEGWTDHAVTREVLRLYLTEALQTCTPEAVILGCTHYPLIAPAIEHTLRDLGSQARIIDSAAATAKSVAASIESCLSNLASPTFTCYATDSTEKFQRLGTHFLGQTIPQVHLLDLGG